MTKECLLYLNYKASYLVSSVEDVCIATRVKEGHVHKNTRGALDGSTIELHSLSRVIVTRAEQVLARNLDRKAKTRKCCQQINISCVHHSTSIATLLYDYNGEDSSMTRLCSARKHTQRWLYVLHCGYALAPGSEISTLVVPTQCFALPIMESS